MQEQRDSGAECVYQIQQFHINTDKITELNIDNVCACLTEEENDQVLLSIIKQIQSKCKPCKKTVQKIIYLIEEAGEDLGYRYEIHFYGPYCRDLEYSIFKLHNYGDLEVDFTPYGHYVSVVSERTVELNDTTAKVIDIFGSKDPSELELITTTLYVQRRLDSIEKSDVLEGIKRIKGSKYSDDQIYQAMSELKNSSCFANQ